MTLIQDMRDQIAALSMLQAAGCLTPEKFNFILKRLEDRLEALEDAVDSQTIHAASAIFYGRRRPLTLAWTRPDPGDGPEAA